MSDFLERNGLQTAAQHFKDLFLASVHRDGAEELLERLENETDFFEAPAGAKHHGAFPGGLVIHSLNVYRRLREITIRDLTPRDALGPAPISEREEETVAILGLLHDVCKAGVYHIERKRRRNPETGVWEDYLGYTFRDPLPLGHGEKSLYQIARFIRLEDHEALAIRWHMGAYDYYKAGNSKVHYRHNATGTAANVWCRSVISSSSNGFCLVSADGSARSNSANYSWALAPCFFV